jgi:hypothetical protein
MSALGEQTDNLWMIFLTLPFVTQSAIIILLVFMVVAHIAYNDHPARTSAFTALAAPLILDSLAARVALKDQQKRAPFTRFPGNRQRANPGRVTLPRPLSLSDFGIYF